VVTQVSAAQLTPPAVLTDTVVVTGLADQPAVVQAALYGPFPSRAAITCDVVPIWTGTIAAGADGT